MIDDKDFEAYAAQQEKEARQRQEGSGGSRSGGDFEKVQWTGLESNRMKLIRAVGGPPDSNIDNTTAKTTRVSWIVGDDGKKFRCVLPERADDPDHLLWRIIARVKAVEWVDRKRVYPVQLKHPQIFSIVEKNGYVEGDKSFIFDRGWEGRQVLIMNVIDREQMDWHRENKHTMLLSRSIGEGKDGVLFPEEGVPSYGFSALLANLFKYYKNWEKYDIGIIRTGLKETPYRIINAGKYFEEVPAELQQYVIQDPLSAEEASWERYDLNKLFGTTKYTKIHNRLKLTVARIDAALGTHFVKELEDFVEIEKKQFAESQPAGPAEATQPVEEVQSKSVRARVQAQTGSVTFDTSLLKGWTLLSAAEKATISGVTVKDGKLAGVQYADANATLLACPECSIPAPDSLLVCPSCGLQFA